jgi:pimeloyl-ACP methyl ester carboxylesterase
MPNMQINDVNVYYEVHGEGEPLLLIGGFNQDVLGWFFQTTAYSQLYKVIVYDHRGVGRTEAPDVPWSFQMMADDAAGLMTGLGIEKAHVLGWSMGGMIAQELALKYPARISSLVLVSTYASPYYPGIYIMEAGAKMLKEGVSQKTYSQCLLPWINSEKFFEKPERVQKTLDIMMAHPYPQSARALFQLFDAYREQPFTRDRLGQITAPTLVIVGKQDILMPVKMSEEIAAGITNAELVVIDGAAHGVVMENWREFNQVVLDFLAKVVKMEG